MKNMLRTFVCASLAVALSGGALLVSAPPLAAQDLKAGTVTITNSWSRAVPRGARVAAGYLSVGNTGTTPDRLVSATAEIAGRAEVHEMAVDANGMMTMHPVPGGIEVPPGGNVALEPGGYHIMFLDLTAEPEVGKPFKGTLTFEKAGTVDVEYAVEPLGGPEPSHNDSPKAGG